MHARRQDRIRAQRERLTQSDNRSYNKRDLYFKEEVEAPEQYVQVETGRFDVGAQLVNVSPHRRHHSLCFESYLLPIFYTSWSSVFTKA